MLPSTLALFTLCLLGADGCRALRVPFEARSIPQREIPEYYHHRLRPRANTTVTVMSASNTQYLANITIGGYVVPS